jgi:cytochrome c-type biogenesis protein CcmH
MKKILLICLLFFTLPAMATQEIYQFADKSQTKRFNQLTGQLRCLVCQNQTIAESNAGLARDLRKQIYEKITHGQTDIEILDYLVTRYGSYILYSPPLNSETWLLWFMPGMVLLFGFLYLLYYLAKNRKREHVLDS